MLCRIESRHFAALGQCTSVAEAVKLHASGSTQDVLFRNSGSDVIYSISLHISCAVTWMFSAVLLSHTSVLTARLGWDGLATKGECFYERVLATQHPTIRGMS